MSSRGPKRPGSLPALACAAGRGSATVRPWTLPREHRRRRAAATGFAALLLVSVTALGTPSAGQSAQPGDSSGELPPLPEVPRFAPRKPEPAEVERLESILSALVSPEEADRRAAAAEVATVHAGLVPAVAQRLDRAADAADRGAMKQLLLDIRRVARDDARRELRALGDKGQVATPDYFEMVVAHADPKRAAWRDLVQVLAMSRMLVAIETVESVRVLIEVYARFNFLRIDTQLQLDKLGDRAVAALLEARRHRAEEVARWAKRRLDALGRAIPGEAVQVRDPEALADVLRAYGRGRDPDAARIVVSFANSERAQVREAARQAIALMGEVGTWQLRDAYEDTVGKRAPRDWSWQRLARELFAAHDRLRLARVHELFEQGRAAEERGDLVGMRRAYDMVLTRSPLFERRGAMAAGYLAYANRFADEDAAGAAASLDRARRVAEQPTIRNRIESLRLTLHAERLREEGIVDQELFQRAADLDANNPRPRHHLAPLADAPGSPAGRRHRWIAAAVIALIAAVGAVFITFWPRRPRVRAASGGASATPPATSEQAPDNGGTLDPTPTTANKGPDDPALGPPLAAAGTQPESAEGGAHPSGHDAVAPNPEEGTATGEPTNPTPTPGDAQPPR